MTKEKDPFEREGILLALLKQLHDDCVKDNNAIRAAIGNMVGDNYSYVSGGSHGAMVRARRRRLALWVLGKGSKNTWIKFRKFGPRPEHHKDVVIKDPISGFLGVGRTVFAADNNIYWKLSTVDNGKETRNSVQYYMEVSDGPS